MNVHEIKKAVIAASNDDLAADSMVYQLWADGEITLTKGGDLLGQRGLHQISRPIFHPDSAEHDTLKLVAFEGVGKEQDEFMFIYCDGDKAHEIQKMMAGLTL